MLAKCGHFSCSPSCTARCGAGDKSVHRGQTLARGGGSRAAALVCCLRRRVHSKPSRPVISLLFTGARGGRISSRPLSCPGRAQRDPGPRGYTTDRHPNPYCASRFFTLGPGSRSTRARALATLGRDTRLSLRHAGAQEIMEMHDTDRLAAVDHHQLRLLRRSGHATAGESLRNPDPSGRDFAQRVPSSFCPARKNLFGSTASPRTRVS
jgi:hypothetical protein